MKNKIIKSLFLSLFCISFSNAKDEKCKAIIPKAVLSQFEKVRLKYEPAPNPEKVKSIANYIDLRNEKEPCDSLNAILKGIKWKTNTVFEKTDKENKKYMVVSDFIQTLDLEIEKINKENTSNQPSASNLSQTENESESIRIDQHFEINDTRISDLENQLKKKVQWIKILTLISSLLLFFILGLFFLARVNVKLLNELFFVKRQDLTTNVDDEKKIKAATKYKEEEFSKVDDNEINHLKREINNLKEEAKILKVENLKLVEENKNLNLKVKESSFIKPEIRPTIPVPINPDTVFYLTFPKLKDNKTFFDDSRLQSYQPANSTYYRFELMKNSSQERAKFWFVANTEHSIANAIQSIETFVKPACDCKWLNTNISKIVTIKEGIAVKRDGVWVVDEKAKIEFQ